MNLCHVKYPYDFRLTGDFSLNNTVNRNCHKVNKLSLKRNLIVVRNNFTHGEECVCVCVCV